MHSENDFLIGLDVGQAGDYSALVTIARQRWTADGYRFLTDAKDMAQAHEWARNSAWTSPKPIDPYSASKRLINRVFVQPDAPHYAVRLVRILRWPLGVPYPTIERDVLSEISKYDAYGVRSKLIVDHTGVGAVVYDHLRDRLPQDAILGVNIHGGEAVTRHGLLDGVEGWPKVKIVMTMIAAFQSGRLGVVRSLENLDVFREEIEAFRFRYSESGHTLYEAARGSHDDIPLAAGLACFPFLGAQEQAILHFETVRQAFNWRA